LKVNVLAAGALTHSLPSGQIIVERESLTVTGLLDSLVAQYGSRMAEELMKQDRLRDGLVLLVNGRNVLSLPEQFETPLQEGDEVLITIMVAGG
jgi:molybdopterin converting factor small subunit